MSLRASKAPTAPRSNGNWNRRSTISSEFYRSIAPIGNYDKASKELAISELEQEDLNNLVCIYCRSQPAQVWDHLFHVGGAGLGEGSRRGHHLRNLAPSCKACNNAKCHKTPEEFFRSAYMENVVVSKSERARRLEIISKYSSACDKRSNRNVHDSPIWREYWDLYRQIEALLKRADELAANLRQL